MYMGRSARPSGRRADQASMPILVTLRAATLHIPGIPCYLAKAPYLQYSLLSESFQTNRVRIFSFGIIVL